jgi:hypothetical protein
MYEEEINYIDSVLAFSRASKVLQGDGIYYFNPCDSRRGNAHKMLCEKYDLSYSDTLAVTDNLDISIGLDMDKEKYTNSEIELYAIKLRSLLLQIKIGKEK